VSQKQRYYEKYRPIGGREMPLIVHETDLMSAISIINSGHFIPCYNDVGAGDSGLNALICGAPQNRGQNIEGRGAKIYLQWDGPVRIGGLPPLEQNMLHDYGAWRAVVPYGTTMYLSVSRLDVDDESDWRSAIGPAPFYMRFSPVLRDFWFERKICELKNNIDRKITEGGAIRVGYPLP
jgi:hypothetical protein